MKWLESLLIPSGPTEVLPNLRLIPWAEVVTTENGIAFVVYSARWVWMDSGSGWWMLDVFKWLGG